MGEEDLPEDVREGHFVVHAVDNGEPKRFVLELAYLEDPDFLNLLKQAEEEFGFRSEGVLAVPCGPNELQKVSGGEERFDELHHRLDYFGDGPAPNDKWLTMPDMGHIIASAFKVALVFLSEKQCLTFLPLHCTPLPPKSIHEAGFPHAADGVELAKIPGNVCNWMGNTIL
ncbi:hypothetical protein Vadar_023844 [Vaccinium darrowii]|uniref:Uncharacterized protein n=1 Tax=Vaccinium darrowii TaxID=229202 RepID=A0ACB7XU36_9ERIC|nr:hypothetical protein Vadar_023844 [Vaccinium darrowii]